MSPAGPLILIAEDELIVAQVLCDQLEAEGYSVLGPASTGEEALALVRRTPPDLLLLDVALKGTMDGVELARLATEGRDLPVIFLTGYVREEVTREVAQLPRATVLTKPVLSEILYARVREALGSGEVPG